MVGFREEGSFRVNKCSTSEIRKLVFHGEGESSSRKEYREASRRNSANVECSYRPDSRRPEYTNDFWAERDRSQTFSFEISIATSQ